MANLRDVIKNLGGSWKILPGGELAPATRAATQQDVLNYSLTHSGQVAPFGVGDTIPDPSQVQVTLVDDTGNSRVVKFSKPTSLAGPVPAEEVADSLDLSVTDVGNVTSGGQNQTKDQIQADLERTKALADQAKAATASAQAQLDQLVKDEAERQKNDQKGLGRITDKDAATLAQQASQTGVSQAQIEINRQQLIQQGAQNAAQQQIAQQQLLIAQANQKLAEGRLGLDERVAGGQLNAQQAATELAKQRLEFDQSNAEANRNLQTLQQTQANQIAQGNLAVSQGTLEQRKAEAAQTAEQNAQTAALNAAQGILTSERQAQTQGVQAGAQLLSGRAQAASGMLQNILGQAMGNKNLMSVPAGLGEGLVGGIDAWTREMMGGQGTLDVATRLVAQANPQAAQSPQAQLATSVLQQMLERYQGLTGQVHPLAQQYGRPDGPQAPPQAQQTTPGVAEQTQATVTPGAFPASATTPYRQFTAPPTYPGLTGAEARGNLADIMAAQQANTQAGFVSPATTYMPAPAAARAPVAARPMATPAAPGGGYDPSAMAARQAAPGFGYDPSSMVAGYGGTVPPVGYEVPTAPAVVAPTATVVPPPSLVNGLNLQGMNINGLNLNGFVAPNTVYG